MAAYRLAKLAITRPGDVVDLLERWAIGAGPSTDGQVLVLHDMLGFGGAVNPKFVRKYAAFEAETRRAVAAYQRDVTECQYPSKEESY